MSDSEKANLLRERTETLKKVKLYIDEHLHPKAPFFPVHSSRSISEILAELNILEVDYYRFLSMSPNEDFEIHYRRPPNSCFVNNY